MRKRLGAGSVELPTVSVVSSRRSERAGLSTFIVEALLLFVCLIVVVAMSIAAFAFASQRGREATLEQEAIVLATNTAERFTADPLSVPRTEQHGTLIVDCAVEDTTDDVGGMYTASIVVYEASTSPEEPLYTLGASKYVSHLSGWREVR